MPFSGGESAGQERLQEILHGKDASSSSALPRSSSPAKASEQQSDHAHTSERGAERKEQSLQGNGLETTQTHAQWGDETPENGGVDRRAASEQGESAGGQDDVEALIHSFRDMRMMASGVDNSAKLSAYLAAGCLSPRQVYWEARNAAEEHGSDTGHSTLIMHLVIRYAGIPL